MGKHAIVTDEGNPNMDLLAVKEKSLEIALDKFLDHIKTEGEDIEAGIFKYAKKIESFLLGTDGSTPVTSDTTAPAAPADTTAPAAAPVEAAPATDAPGPENLVDQTPTTPTGDPLDNQDATAADPNAPVDTPVDGAPIGTAPSAEGGVAQA